MICETTFVIAVVAAPVPIMMVAAAYWIAFFMSHETIIAFATVALVVFTWKLAKVGEKQNEYTRILQRAYISVEALGVKPFGESSWAHISVRNNGRLPATKVRWFIAYKIARGRFREFKINDKQFYGTKAFIPAGGEMRRSQRCRFSSDKISLFRECPEDGRWFLFLWGEIQYEDGFGKKRCTKFCHRYDRLQIEEITSGPNAGGYMLPAESMRTPELGNEAT